MAPEFPPRLVVIALEDHAGTISASIENVETAGDQTLQVKWSELDSPAGYRPVGNGAAFVKQADGVLFLGPTPITLDQMEGNRYRWIQGTPWGTPFVMIVLVLPAGYTLRSQPAPTSAKFFADRIAVYWCLEGDKLGRTQVEFDLQRPNRGLADEVRRLNSLSSLQVVPPKAHIEIDTGGTRAPSRKVSVFLCHSSEDKVRVRQLYEELKEVGFAPWLDSVDIVGGYEWEKAIPDAVRNSDLVLVCLSRESIKKVGFVQKEIGFALSIAQEHPEGAVFIVPVRLEECDIPDRLSKYQAVDLHAEDGHERLLIALRKRASQLTQN